MNRILLAVLTLLAPLAAAPAAAHTQSYGFLIVTTTEDTIEGTLALAVRDLDAAVGLDADADGSITWGEVRGREAALAETVLAGLRLGPPGQPCALVSAPLLTDTRGGEPYLVLPFRADCTAGVSGEDREISYDLLFDVDAQHRLIATVSNDGATRSLVLTPAERTATLLAAGTDGFELFLGFVVHGAHHIWIGYDHILFVVTLMLGAVVERRGGRWVPVGSGRDALVAICKVVTAFTVAHSVTLALAALDVVRLPSVLIETAIAATITLAALNLVFPVVTRRLWVLAFGFGLIHGFGFANVLADLDLPAANLVTALVAFNIGVELGQFAIVAVLLPGLLLLAHRPLYARAALPVAAVMIAAIGTAWLVGRAFDVTILPIG